MDGSYLIGFGAFTDVTTPPPASSIVSIQQFEITIGTSATSNTATISTVNTSNSVIFFQNFTTTHTGNTYREILPRIALTNSTTVTATRDTASASFTVTVRGTVVEFASSAISSIQTGTFTIPTLTASGTATISSVNTARSVVFYFGHTISTATTSSSVSFCGIDLTNSTTVTATRGTSNAAVITISYAVVEFSAAVIASVQRRVPAFTSSGTTNADTISSVTAANTLLIYGGVQSTSTAPNNYLYSMQLTSSTNVNAVRTGTSTTSRTLYYMVLEFASGVISTMQRGTTALASVTSADTTITSVTTSKALCNATHFSTNASANAERYATAKLLDATTVRAQKDTAGTTTSTVGYEVAEFV